MNPEELNSLWQEYQASQQPAQQPDINALWSEYQASQAAPVEQPQQAAGPDFMTRMSGDLDKFVNRAGEIGNAGIYNKQQTTPETLFQAGTNAIGFGGNILGNVLGSGARYAGDIANYAAPETYQAAGQNLGQAAQYISQSPIGDAARYIGNEYQDLNPRAKRNVDALGVGASLVPAGKVVGPLLPEVGELSLLGKAGQKVQSLAEKQRLEKRQKLAENLVTRRQTQKEIGERPVADESGILRQRTPLLTDWEKDAALELTKIPDIKAGKSLQGNFNIVDRELQKETSYLQGALGESNIKVPVAEFHNGLNAIENSISSMDKISEAQRGLLLRTVQTMKELSTTNKGDISLSELLQARRDLDSALEVAAGDKLTPAVKKIYGKGVSDIRNYTNDFIASKIPDAAVKESLKRQSNLIVARKNMLTKLKPEAVSSPNRIARAADRALDIIPFKSELGRLGLVAGAGTIGALTGVAPLATGIGGAAYLTGKALKSASAKSGVGAVLKGADKLVPRSGAAMTTTQSPAQESQKLLTYAEQPKQLPAPDKNVNFVDKQGNITQGFDSNVTKEARALGTDYSLLQKNLQKEILQKYGQSPIGQAIAKNPYDTLEGQGVIKDIIYKEFNQSKVNLAQKQRMIDSLVKAQNSKLTPKARQAAFKEAKSRAKVMKMKQMEEIISDIENNPNASNLAKEIARELISRLINYNRRVA